MNRVVRFGGYALATVAALLVLGLLISSAGGRSTQGQTISSDSVAAASELPIKGQLGDCLDDTNVAWGFNNTSKQWSSFDPDLPDGLQGVTELAVGGGYFLNTSNDCTLANGDVNVAMYTGWNLFGWLVPPGAAVFARDVTALTPGMVGFVGIDMDSSGNTATSLGAVQNCNTVAVNATLDIDVVVDAIDPADPFNAFQFMLNYDSSKVTVTAINNQLLLTAKAGSGPIFDFSETPPDSDGDADGNPDPNFFLFSVSDFSSNAAAHETGKGVLSRITLKGVAGGVSDLTITPSPPTNTSPSVVKWSDSADLVTGTTTIGNAKVAVGQSCPAGGTPTPTATPTGGTPTTTPTSTPTPTPTNTPTPTPTQTSPTPTPTGGLPIKQQLDGCLDDTNVAWGFDNLSKGWSSFDPDLPDQLQGVMELMRGGGYFANTSANCTIAFGDNDIDTMTGWNLFGWQ